MWKYEQLTGNLSHDGVTIGVGYSGHAEGKNNPAMQNVKMTGPIPCGNYRIGPAFDHSQLGPHVMSLTPLPETETFERSGFYMHGDDKHHPGEGSEGCIVMSRVVRDEVSESNDTLLNVVSGVSDGAAN